MKKSDVTQELVNVFPTWSKTRNDPQSVGYQVLNSVAGPVERMEKQLQTVRDNQYLTTANLDEIDLTYRVQLGTTFVFDEDLTDPLFPCPVAPSVSGVINNVAFPVTIADDNDLQSFWYNSVPNRATLAEVVSGVEDLLLDYTASDVTTTGLFPHHFTGGGDIFIEATGGVEYLTVEDNIVRRGKAIISGRTRKDTIEEETLIFAWDQKQKMLQEWKEIRSISLFNIEDTVQIEVRSADFNAGPYISPWNLKYSPNRLKIDEFWDVGHNGTIPTLDRIEYQTDEWQQLVLGFSTKEVKDSWELLETTANTISGVNITVSGVDLALQPYSDLAWIATSDNRLLAYDLSELVVSGIDKISTTTPGAHVQLEQEELDVLLGEDIEFEPWHVRPLKEIASYRIWYELPDGQKFGLLNGVSVAFTSNFVVVIPEGTDITRTVESLISITTTQRGEHLVVLEVTFADGEQQEYRRIFRAKYKLPVTTIDISSLVPDTITGIDFDADQKLWVKTTDDYYRINLHADIMLIDYTNRILYFKEDYDLVGIETDG
jgi:hypothetical protein